MNYPLLNYYFEVFKLIMLMLFTHELGHFVYAWKYNNVKGFSYYPLFFVASVHLKRPFKEPRCFVMGFIFNLFLYPYFLGFFFRNQLYLLIEVPLWLMYVFMCYLIASFDFLVVTVYMRNKESLYL